MADLVTIMKTFRKSPGYIPDWAWYRDGEESAVMGSGDVGSIEASTWRNSKKGSYKCIRKRLIKEFAREWVPKYR